MAQLMNNLSTNAKSTTVNSTDRDNQQSIGENHRCGLGRCTPAWLQCCADIKAFILYYGISGMMTQSMIFYMVSQITTIEKQFGLSSLQSGFLLSSNDIGFVMVVLVGSHLARNVHRPTTLGVLSTMFGVLAILCAFPHFFMSYYDREFFFFSEDFSQRHVCGISANVTSSSTVNTRTTNDLDTLSYIRTLCFVWLCLTTICIGAVKAPRLALLTTYIDDHVTKTKSGIYFGVLTATFTLSAALGFGVGSIFSNVHVTLSDSDLTPKDSRWVGAWWLGFVVFGTIAIVTALPLLCFPNKLSQPIRKVPDSEIQEGFLLRDADYTAAENTDEIPHMKVSIELSQTITNSSQSNECKKINTYENPKIQLSYKNSNEPVNEEPKNLSNEDDEDGVNQIEGFVDSEQTRNVENGASGFKLSAKDFLMSVRRISSNRMYMFTVLGNIIFAVVVQGNLAYMPKYMESNFMMVASRANMMMGITWILGAAAGMFIGGAIVTYLKLSVRGCYVWIIVVMLLTTTMSLLRGTLKCEQPIFRDYNNSFILENKYKIGPIQVQCADSNECSCTDDQFMPVCGSDGNNYFSPCHAGCTGIKDSMFYNCSCVNYLPASNTSNNTQFNAFTESSKTARPSYCPSDCNSINLFLILISFSGFLGCTTVVSKLVIILRIVKQEDRSLAVGLDAMLRTLFGGLLSPILYGAIVDTSCVLWRGYCQLYDINDFRIKFNLYVGWIGYLGACMYASSLRVLLCSKKYADNDMEIDEQSGPILSILRKMKTNRKYDNKKERSP